VGRGQLRGGGQGGGQGVPGGGGLVGGGARRGEVARERAVETRGVGLGVQLENARVENTFLFSKCSTKNLLEWYLHKTHGETKIQC
jgi:hypothetical protein